MSCILYPWSCYDTSHEQASTAYRAFGTSVVGCMAGYEWPGCTSCPVGRYCPGGTSASAACPQSMTTLVGGAASVGDCVCSPGYYTFAGASLSGCIACGKGFWCMGGKHAPIPCHADGTTLDTGSSSPTSCICPSGTYTLQCLECPRESVCSSAHQPTQLTTLSITGWGSSSQDSAPLGCNITGGAVMYSVSYISPSVYAQQSLYSGSVPLSWVLVLPDIPNTAWLTDCLVHHFCSAFLYIYSAFIIN